MTVKKGSTKGPIKGRRLNQEMILKATSLARGRSEGVEAFLGRVTHLHLQNKRILEMEGLDLCVNLKVLYLYDNRIEEIKNVEFAKILSYLYLQNNMITSLPSELEMPSLKKLYLDENQVEYVTGLEGCPILEELFLARQKIPSYSSLEFDLASLQAVSETLQVIDISGNNIISLQQLQCLQNLRRIFAQDNNISNVAEVEAVIALPRIEEVDFQRNPCCTVHRYRDYAIAAASDTLIILDEKEVLKHQQIAIRGLMTHRQKIGAAFPSTPNPGPELDGMNLEAGSIFNDVSGDGQSLDIGNSYTEKDDQAFGAIPSPAEAKDGVPAGAPETK